MVLSGSRAKAPVPTVPALILVGQELTFLAALDYGFGGTLATPSPRQNFCTESLWNHWIFMMPFAINIIDVNTVLTGAVSP